MRFMLVSVVLAPLVLFSASPLLSGSSVAVTVNKVRPGKGMLHITLVNKEQFLMRRKLKKPFMKSIVKTLGKSVQYEFKDVPPGDYAVQVLQDFDGNGDMTDNWMGIPKEPWGMSNNPPVGLGGPKWERAKFTVTDNSGVVKVSLDLR
jgi:uncharacterized protein (DUF2141 family)